MADPRESYLAANLYTRSATLSKEAEADLKYFAAQAAKGRPITFIGLAKWMKEHHGLIAARRRMHTLALEAGVTPWWKP